MPEKRLQKCRDAYKYEGKILPSFANIPIITDSRVNAELWHCLECNYGLDSMDDNDQFRKCDKCKRVYIVKE